MVNKSGCVEKVPVALRYIRITDDESRVTVNQSQCIYI